MTRFAPVIAAAVLGVALAPAAVADDPTPDAALDADTRAVWMVRVARMEGASVDVEEAAAALAATAQSIADAGRVQDVALLSGQAELLKRKVISASLASEVLDDL